LVSGQSNHGVEQFLIHVSDTSARTHGKGFEKSNP